MAIQTATTGNLENAQNIVIAKSIIAAEYNQPCWNTCQSFTLGKGEKTITVPKVGQITLDRLQDGVDIVASKDIVMATTDLTTSETGGKIIMTDKLLRQANDDIWKMVGELLGNGMGRIRNRDVITIYAGFGYALGTDNAKMILNNVAAAVAAAKSYKFPSPMIIVHHPNAIARLVMNAAGVGTAYFAGIMSGYPEEKLRDFWKINVSGVNVLETGDIDKITSVDSGYGAIYSKSAIAAVQSLAPTTETERDASLRGYEMVMVSDYGVFELENQDASSNGASLRFEIGTISTTATDEI